jgi:TP901 family phage tail tape measure protein
MADELHQKIGFDVSDALSGISALNDSLAGLSTNLKNLGKSGIAVTDVGDKIKKSLTEAGVGVEKFGSQTEDAAKKVGPQLTNLTVSFETLSRVILTQFVVRALTTLRTAISDSIAQFIDFQKAIAELAVIGDDIGNFQQLGNAVLAVSNNFNIDRIEAARGAYQAVSAQIVKTAGDFDLLNQVALFTQATNSEFEPNVNALATALNAFGKTAGDSGKVLSEFLEAVKLGRVRAEELSGALSKVAPTAGALGISLEEVLATFDALSNRGVKVSEAATQLNSILTAIIKPSGDMATALDKVAGASDDSARELFAAKGLLGGLRELNATTSGSIESLAKLFPNIRALRGEAGLAADNLVAVSAAQKKLIDTSASLSADKGFEVLAQSGQQIQTAWRQVSNDFVTKIAPSLLDTAAAALKVVGGAEGIISAIEPLIGLAGELTVGLAAMAAGLGIVKLRALDASTSMTTFNRTIFEFVALEAALSGAQKLGDDIGKIIASVQFANVASIGQNAADQLSVEKDTTQQIKGELQKRLEAAKTIGAQAILNLRAEQTQEIGIIRQGNADQITNTKSALNVILELQSQRVEKLKKVAQDAKGELDSSLKRAQDLEQTLGDDTFERQIKNLTAPGQFDAIVSRAHDTLDSAKTLFLNATDPKSFDRAIDVFAEAKKQLDAAKALADNPDSSFVNRFGEDQRSKAQTDIQQELVNFTQSRLDLEKQIQTVLQQREKIAEKEALQEQDRQKRLRDITDTIVKNSLAFDKQGNPISDEAITKQKQALSTAFQQLGAELKASDKLDADKIFNLASFGQSLKSTLTNVQVQALELGPHALDDIKAKIAETEIPIKIKIDDNSKFEQTIQNAIQAVADESQKSLANIKKQATAQAIQAAANAAQGVGPLNLVATSHAAEFAKLALDLNDAVQSGTLGPNQLEFFKSQITQLGALTNALKSGAQTAFEGEVTLAEQLVKSQTEVKTSIDATLAPLDIANQTQQQLADAAERQLAAYKNMPGAISAIQPTATQGAVGQYFGGLMSYFANGGVGRGQDRIPAFLSAGEFVVNARSAGRFFSQLQAINAGQTPVFRNQGGTVNVTVGDVNVQASSSPRATGRAIAQEISREIRRGSIRKF